MPNWVATRIKAKNVDMLPIYNDKGDVDFEKIIPMPDDIYRGDLGPKERELYGEKNWYNRSCSNWGTKWNAYNTETDIHELYFETAWSCPFPIVEKIFEMIREKYSDEEDFFEFYWADEGGITENSGCGSGNLDGLSYSYSETNEDIRTNYDCAWGFELWEETEEEEESNA